MAAGSVPLFIAAGDWSYAHTMVALGIVFMFAPLMHPAMRHVGPVRRELGVPTVMNMVGPLANPARAGRQVVGVSDQRRVALMAGALRELGTVHAMVVHGEPGMDEVSPLGPTQVIEIRGKKTKEWTIDPTRFGFGKVRPRLKRRRHTVLSGSRCNRSDRAVNLTCSGCASSNASCDAVG